MITAGHVCGINGTSSSVRIIGNGEWGRIWAGHIARMGDRNAYKVLVGKNLSRLNDLEDLGIDGRIIL
jgi:hypothetical protein